MTEAEWNACTDPQPMFQCLQTKSSERKVRLFSLTCFAQIEKYVDDPRVAKALQLAEVIDSLVTTQEGFSTAYARAESAVAEMDADIVWGSPDELVRLRSHQAALYAATDRSDYLVSWHVAEAIAIQAMGAIETKATDHAMAIWRSRDRLPDEELATLIKPAAEAMDQEQNLIRSVSTAAKKSELARHAHLLREIYGPLPFRSISVDPARLAWNNNTVAHLAQAIYSDRAFDRMPILADALEDSGCHDPDILEHCRGSGPHVRGCWVVDKLLGRA